jgi:VCBS repeat-containing protein
VTYSGDNNFNPSSGVANFTVEKATPTVKVNTTNIDYNNTEPIGVNVTGVDGGVTPTGNVTIVITDASGDEVYNKTVPIENGVVSVDTSKLPAGDYNVTVIYNGDANYIEATGKANFTVGMINSTVVVDPVNITYGDNETVKFNVTDGATGTVNITITGDNGVTVTFTDVPLVNGTVGVNVPGLAAGNYSVNVTYSGDNNFNPSSGVANFTVEKATPTVKVNTTNIDYNNTEPISVNVTGVDGGVVPTGNVTIVVTDALA